MLHDTVRQPRVDDAYDACVMPGCHRLYASGTMTGWWMDDAGNYYCKRHWHYAPNFPVGPAA